MRKEADRWSDGTVRESHWPTDCPSSMKRVKVFCIARFSVPTVVMKSQVFWDVMIC